MSPPRTLVVAPLAEMRGGVERMLMNMLRANAATERREYSLVFLEDGPMVEEARALGVQAEVVVAGRLRQPVGYSRTVRRLVAIMRRENVDAVLSWAAKCHLYAGPAARIAGIPCAWYVHSIPDGHWLDRLVTAVPADLVLCCSRAAEAAQRQMRPARRTRTVHIAVDTDMFDPDALPSRESARASLGIPPDGPLLTMVARLQRWKGVDVFVSAAGRLSASHTDARFAVVGGPHFSEPDYPAELEAQVAALAIGDRFHFAGARSDVPVWMAASDVLVHASFDEPAGAVVIEGMAAGRAVVAARTAGPMEFIEDGATGRLAAPGDEAELASVIGELLDDPDQRRRLGEAARARARDFSADKLAANVAAAMDAIAVSSNARDEA